MYWAMTRHGGLRQNIAETTCVAGSYLWATSAVYVYYAGQLGIFIPEAAVPIEIIVTLMIVIGCVGSYYASTKRSNESDIDSK